MACLVFSGVTVFNRQSLIYQYFNIAPRLSGHFSSVSQFSKETWNTKTTMPDIEVWPESLWTKLEYGYIERGSNTICGHATPKEQPTSHPLKNLGSPFAKLRSHSVSSSSLYQNEMTFQLNKWNVHVSTVKQVVSSVFCTLVIVRHVCCYATVVRQPRSS